MVRPPDNAIKGDTLVKELALGYDETMVDLYISTDANPDAVGALGNYGVLVENIHIYICIIAAQQGNGKRFFMARLRLTGKDCIILGKMCRLVKRYRQYAYFQEHHTARRAASS